MSSAWTSTCPRDGSGTAWGRARSSRPAVAAPIASSPPASRHPVRPGLTRDLGLPPHAAGAAPGYRHAHGQAGARDRADRARVRRGEAPAGRGDPSSGSASAAPAVDTAGMPREFQSLLAARPDPAQILRQRGALPGLRSIKGIAGELSGGEGDADSASMRPFADEGSRAELRKLRADVRRDFDALNRLYSPRRGASPAEVSTTLAEVYSAPV